MAGPWLDRDLQGAVIVFSYMHANHGFCRRFRMNSSERHQPDVKMHLFQGTGGAEAVSSGSHGELHPLWIYVVYFTTANGDRWRISTGI